MSSNESLIAKAISAAVCFTVMVCAIGGEGV